MNRFPLTEFQQIYEAGDYSKAKGASHPMTNIYDELEWQILDMFSQNGQIKIASPMGQIINLPREIFETNLGGIYTIDIKPLFVEAVKVLSSTPAEKVAYRELVIHDYELGGADERSFPSFFERAAYTICTDNFELARQCVRELYHSENEDEVLGEVFGYYDKELQNRLAHFSGWSIVAENTRIPKIPSFEIQFEMAGTQRLVADKNNTRNRCTAEKILSIKEKNPSIPKAAVKLQFPEASYRKFNTAWAKAAKVNPSISFAGRKSKQ